MKTLKDKKFGSSTVEYMAVVALILGALLVFQKYISQGVAGGWKRAADTWGQTKQYDPRIFGESGIGGGTLECFFDTDYCRPNQSTNTKVAPRPDVNGNCNGSAAQYINTWIDRRCEERNCDCSLPVEDPNFNQICLQCLSICRHPMCGSDLSWDWPPAYAP